MPNHYRFRGAIQPSASVKTPVRAELIGETDTGSGAKLYLHDVIDSWGGDWGVSAKEFTVALAQLGDVSEITLHINSPGGEVYEGIAILNALRTHPATVNPHVDGLAASAASFIAVGLAAEPGAKLTMGRNTELMIHDAWGIALGPAADMHAAGDRLDAISDNIAGIYASKAGGDASTWRTAMLAESWYSDAESVAAGLADEIEGATVSTEDVENAFDLSVFRNAGRSNAPAPTLDPGEPDLDIELPSTAKAERDARVRRNLNRLNLRAKSATARR